MTREECRYHAAECLALAQQTTDENQKAKLLQMAQAWTELAERAVNDGTDNGDKK